MIADIAGPAGNARGKLRLIVCEQRPRRFFKTGQIAGHGRHEMISGVSRGATAIAVAVGPARRFDKFS